MEKPELLPLSVVVIARNEQVNLRRCLASVAGWVSEIVVALNGTTDASASVAQAAGARVVELSWKGFRDTKNEALDLATQPWRLCLDADEAVSPELRDSIRRFLASPESAACAGARFPRMVHFLGRWIRHGDWYPDYAIRLVAAGRGRWGGDAIVHEKMVCTGPVATLKGDLYHYSFPTLASHVSKMMPFAELHLQQQRERRARFSAAQAVFRPAWRFFRAYVIRAGFLDGYPGFYIACGTAFGTFVRHTRVYEAELP